MSLNHLLRDLEKTFWQKRRSNTTPSILQHDYLILKGLVNDIQKSINYILKKTPQRKWTIVDIGSGEKPYFKLFEPYIKSYVGIDVSDEGNVFAQGESLPIKSNSTDLVICFQVLEHCHHPESIAREIRRILKPNGWAIVSTHGIWLHHPMPHDYFRWTGEGLHYLFRNFREVNVLPNLRSIATILQIINIELYSLACRKLWLKLPLYITITIINLLGSALMQAGQDYLVINYTLAAKR